MSNQITRDGDLEVTDYADGRIWIASWNGNHTELRQLPDKDQPWPTS